MLDEVALRREVRRWYIQQFFPLVQGSRPGDPDRKAMLLERHLARLELRPAAVGLIGDTCDDADAARAVGCSAVLLAGTHDQVLLETTGFPVVEGLVQAIDRLGLRPDGEEERCPMR